MREYFAVAAGVALSILLPVLAAAVRRAFPAAPTTRAGLGGPAPTLLSRVGDVFGLLWPIFRPYLLLFLFSLVVAVVVVAFAPPVSAHAAFIAGYVWDSTLQKIAGRPQ